VFGARQGRPPTRHSLPQCPSPGRVILIMTIHI
jgi:hypothetical protein